MSAQVGTAMVLAVMAAYGAFLVYSAAAFGWRGIAPAPGFRSARGVRARLREWLVQAGLGDARAVEVLAIMGVLAAFGGLAGWAIFGGLVVPLIVAALTGAFPIVSARSRRQQRRAKAQEAWPRMLEELRLQATTMGRSVPQALFIVGRRGPEELRPAFAAAEREWMVSTDFDRTTAVLKAELADPTADAVCETLVVAHEVGGSDLGERLDALVADRIQDLRGRKDARSKQAGARFARWFVLIVPAGMALAGLTIGDGRQAYQTDFGQFMVAMAAGLLVLCWLGSSYFMKLPEEGRVFYE